MLIVLVVAAVSAAAWYRRSRREIPPPEPPPTAPEPSRDTGILYTLGTIIDIDHETGDLSQYTSSVTDGGDLSVAAGAALAGTGYGLSCLIDDTTSIYGLKTFNKAATLRLRFYIDPNTLTMADNDIFETCRIGQAGGSYSILSSIELKYVTGTGYILQFRAYNDANAATPDTCNITDAPHYVEALIVRAATDVSADGTAQWWVDGVNQGTVTGIDNYNRMEDQNMRVILGPCSGIDVGTSGTLFLDELIINNDGSEIGPVILPATGGAKPHRHMHATMRMHT